MTTNTWPKPAEEKPGSRLVQAVQARLARSGFAEFSLWAFWKRYRAAMVGFFIVLGVAVVFTLFVGALAAAGELGNFYGWLIDQTNAGQPWTDFMRDHRAIFPVGALVVFLGLGAWLVPWKLWAPAYLVAFVVFFLGFLGGHVYWN